MNLEEHKFKLGQIVHHKLYDYYGVIAKADDFCQANDTWYSNNRTQPNRSQPWYNILVDGGSETYVAEENLELDHTGKKIDHPMIDHMFSTYHKGRYFPMSLN